MDKNSLKFIYRITIAHNHRTYAQLEYPVECREAGNCSIATVQECMVLHDPLPFHWTTTFTLKLTVKWAR